MKAMDALRVATGQLESAGVPSAAWDAGWLLGHALGGLSRSAVLAQPQRLLTAAEAAELAALTSRRAAREPLQYVLGTQPFYGLDLMVTPAVLIPRAETEELVDEVVRRLRAGATAEPLYLADICTGSGAIALALAATLPGAHVWATDLSADALQVAKANAERTGLRARVTFTHGDLLAPLVDARTPAGALLHGRLAALVCNPPYVADQDLAHLEPEVRDWEPQMALITGTGDALHFYRRLAAEAQAYLRPGGLLAVELGLGQAQDVMALLQAAGWQDVTSQRDSQGVERMVLCRRG